MHVKPILHELLSTTIHKTRVNTLEVLLTGLIDSKKLKLTLLGRSIPTEGQERSGILRVDRFLRNPFYQNNSIKIYEQITSFVVGDNAHPDILVDWSSLPNSHYTTEGAEHCVLRASYASEGRAITLYETVHPKKEEGHPNVHRAFLEALHSILPTGCKPCIITDAGFKTPWFKVVRNLGWDYIGRVACGTSSFDSGKGFQSVRTLFKSAKKLPQFIGTYLLTKSNCFKTNFYSYKKLAKGRHKWSKTTPKKIAKDKDSRKYGKSYREPWILVSSYHGEDNAKMVVNKYKTRMTIEENIRDTKSTNYGLSLNENKTINPKRYIVWLMLAALASLIAWIVGFSAEKEKLHYSFQANTYRHRRVLSFFYLGCQVIKKKIPIPIELNVIRDEAWGSSKC